jgi:hypothetical protein
LKNPEGGVSEEAPSVALRRLIDGYKVTQAVYVAATLGIADLLADGPRGSDDLAAATGTDAGVLRRLLRALAALGVLEEHDGTPSRSRPWETACVRTAASRSPATAPAPARAHSPTFMG